MEVPRRQQVGGDDDPLGAAPAGRGDGVGHRRLRGRAVPGGDRPGPRALQQVGGVLDVGDRPAVAGAGRGQHDGGARVARDRRRPAPAGRAAPRPAGRPVRAAGRRRCPATPRRHRRCRRARGSRRTAAAGRRRPPARRRPAPRRRRRRWAAGRRRRRPWSPGPGRRARAASASSAISRRPVALRVPWAQATRTGARRSQGAEDAAVDGDHRAGDVGGRGREQERGDPAELLRAARRGRSGMPASVRARMASASPDAASISAIRSVAIVPGRRPNTRIPRGPSSSASAFAVMARPGRRPLEIARCPIGWRTEVERTKPIAAPSPRCGASALISRSGPEQHALERRPPVRPRRPRAPCRAPGRRR